MKKYYLIIGLALISIGCSNSADSTSSTVLIPLSPLNKWVYDNIFISPTGDTTRAFRDTSFIGLTTILQQQTYYFYNNSGVFAFAGDSFGTTLTTEGVRLVRNANDGLHIFNESTEHDDLTFKHPATTGDHYIVFSDSSATRVDGPIVTEIMDVLSTNESVTTPDGTFSCYHYHASIAFNGEITSTIIDAGDYFIAPSVGIIKFTTQSGSAFNNGQQWIKTLISHTIR